MTETEALDYIKEKYNPFLNEHDPEVISNILLTFNTQEFYEKAFKANHLFIREIPDPSYELCLTAINHNVIGFANISKKVIVDETMCEIAIKNFWYSITSVPERLLTPEICLFTIKMFKESDPENSSETKLLNFFNKNNNREKVKTIDEAILLFQGIIDERRIKNQKLIKETIKQL